MSLEPANNGYDLAMEVLCTLPLEPCYMPLSSLVDRFQLAGQGLLRQLLDRISQLHDIRIIVVKGACLSKPPGFRGTWTCQEGHLAAIARERGNWDRAQHIAELYWDRMGYNDALRAEWEALG